MLHTETPTGPLSTTLTRRSALKLGAAFGAAGLLPLSGCAQSATAGGRHTLNMWSWSTAKALTAGFHAVTKGNPQFQNVEFDVQLYANSVDVSQHLTLRLAAREVPPDIVMVNYLGVPELAAADVLADLSEIIDPVRDDLYDGARTVVTYGDKTVAVPYTLKSKLFYYREDFFQQAGIDPATIVSASDFIEAGHRFHDKFSDRYMLGIGPTLDNGMTGEIMSAFPNGRFASESGEYEVTTNPCFQQTLEFQKQLFDSGIGLPVQSFSADWPPAIKNGVIGAFLTAQWMKTYLPQYAGADQAGRWKAMLWPKLDPLPDQRYGSDQGGAVWIVPKDAPNRELAIEYLRSGLLDPAGSMAYFETTAQPPLLRSTRDNALDYLQNKRKPADMNDAQWFQQPENFFGPDYFPLEFESYDYARTFKFDPSAPMENEMFNTAAGAAYTGQKSIAAALNSAQKAMENQIGNPYLG